MTNINEIDFAVVRASITNHGQLTAIQVAERLAWGADALARFFNDRPGSYAPVGDSEKEIIAFFCANGIRAKFADFKKSCQ